MSAVAIVTLAGIALTVLALAAYLLHVIWLLHRTSFNLGTIVAGLNAIAHQAQPIEAIVTDIDRDLDEVKQALESILGTPLTGEYLGRDSHTADV